jgi:hypothetical protein
MMVRRPIGILLAGMAVTLVVAAAATALDGFVSASPSQAAMSARDALGSSGASASVGLGGTPSAASGIPQGVPATLEGLPVDSVSEAIVIRDSGSSQRIAVAGWFEAFAVPCPMRPDAVEPYEDCAVDFTWLLAAPEQLSVMNADGSGEIHPPIGPGINPIIDRSPNAAPELLVAIGHFNDSGAWACPAGDRRARCAARFIVEEVPWSASPAPPGSASSPERQPLRSASAR